MTSNQADSTDDGTDDRVDDGTEDGVDGGVDGGADLLPMIENILALVRTLPRHPRRLDEDGIRALARWLGTATGDVRAEVDPADPVEAMTFAARKLEEALPTVREAGTVPSMWWTSTTSRGPESCTSRITAKGRLLLSSRPPQTPATGDGDQDRRSSWPRR
jgi:hypothetical protein